jgi:hypothetical protein
VTQHQPPACVKHSTKHSRKRRAAAREAQAQELVAEPKPMAPAKIYHGHTGKTKKMTESETKF